MDEQLQAKIDEAKANGYSDEEIQQYLATKDQPIQQEQPIDRSGEYGATAELMGASLGMGALETAAKAAEYGIPAAIAYKAISRPTSGPVAPSVPAQAQQAMPAQQAVNAGKPNLSVQTGGAAPQARVTPAAPAAPTGVISNAQSIVQKLALDKVLKGAGIAAGAYEMGKGLFGTSPEEIAIMKEAEARKRAQGWKPMNER